MSDVAPPTPSGDRELYVVEESDWSFPIFADPCSRDGVELMLVQPAVGGDDKKQLEVLMAVLKPCAAAASEDGSNRMWIEKSVLMTVARKAPGITPSYYLRWHGEQADLQPDSTFVPRAESLTENQEAFVNFLVNKCALLDRVQAHIFLQAFRQAGLEWIAYYKRQIDFGWFRIVPLPFRVNWKETLYAIEEAYLQEHQAKVGFAPKLWLSRLKGSKPERNEWFAQRRQDCFLDTKLFDMHQSEHFARWHLNLVEGSEYRDYVKQVESEERRVRGPAKYSQAIIRQISARCGSIMDILSDWAAKIAGPCGAVERKRGDSQQILIPLKKPDTFMARGPKPPVLPVVVDDSPEFTSPEALQTVAEKAKGVRTVLYLQPDQGHVRDSRSDVVSSSNGRTGSEGMSLHDGHENVAPGS